MSTQEVLSEFHSIVQDVREQEIKSRFSNSDGDIPHDPLQGYCHENAIALASKLKDSGYKPYIVWGGVVNEKYNSFEDIHDLEHSGRTHFWIELTTDANNHVYMELSSESDQWKNQPYCSFDLPNEYRYMISDPSYLYYDYSITIRDLLSVDDYYYFKNSTELLTHEIEG